MAIELKREPVDPIDAQLTITVVDEPGAGGANQQYIIEGFDTATNPSGDPDNAYQGTELLFQRGPAPACGLTMEALTEVIIHRLNGFQSGPFPHPQNAIALEHYEKALAALHTRTMDLAATDTPPAQQG